MILIGNLLFALIVGMLFTGGGFLHFGKTKIEVASPEVWTIVLIFLALVWTKIRSRPLFQMGWTGRAIQILEADLSSLKSTRARAMKLTLITVVILFLGHVLRHFALHNHGCDVSMVHQPLFYPWGNPPLRADFSRAGTGLSEHILYSFFILAPLTSLFKSNVLIYALQALILGTGLVVLVWKGPLRKMPQATLAAVLLLFCYKGFRGSFVWDFREDAIAFLTLALMYVSLVHRNLKAYFITFAIALVTKENIFAMTFLFSVPILFSKEFSFNRRERWRLALITVLLSILYAVLAFKVLIPIYTHGDRGHALFSRYGAYGSSVPGIVINLLTSPRIWFELLSQIFNRSGILYLVFLFLPLLPFIRSREVLIWLVPAFAGIGMNIAHPYHTQRMMIFHYELIIYPFLFVALLVGMKEALEKKKTRSVIWAIALGLCVFGRAPAYYLQENFPTKLERETSWALGSLESKDRVAVGERLSAQVNHLPHLRIFSEPNDNHLWSTGDLDNWIKKTFAPDVRTVIIDQVVPFENRLRDRLMSLGAVPTFGQPDLSKAMVLQLPTQF